MRGFSSRAAANHPARVAGISMSSAAAAQTTAGSSGGVPGEGVMPTTVECAGRPTSSGPTGGRQAANQDLGSTARGGITGYESTHKAGLVASRVATPGRFSSPARTAGRRTPGTVQAVAERKHGTLAMRARGECRTNPCDACLEAGRRYERRRHKLKTMGHAPYVDAGRARAHVQKLLGAGMTVRQAEA